MAGQTKPASSENIFIVFLYHVIIIFYRLVNLSRVLKLFQIIVVRIFSDELSIGLLGGIWKVKEQANLKKSTILRNLFIEIYTAYLSKYCCYIGYTAVFENKPILPHNFFGIFISRNARIGRNCVIFPHVVIGSNTLIDSKKKGSPTIGDNVMIGAGAVVIGNVRIGNNCRIGSNCIVTRDIPDNSLVIMEKPVIIAKEEMDNTYYTHDADDCWKYVIDGKKYVETDASRKKALLEMDIEWEQKKAGKH